MLDKPHLLEVSSFDSSLPGAVFFLIIRGWCKLPKTEKNESPPTIKVISVKGLGYAFLTFSCPPSSLFFFFFLKNFEILSDDLDLWKSDCSYK